MSLDAMMKERRAILKLINSNTELSQESLWRILSLYQQIIGTIAAHVESMPINSDNLIITESIAKIKSLTDIMIPTV